MLRVRSLGTVPYHEAYALQHALATEAVDDYLLVLAHPHTYTLGAHADERNVLVDPAAVGAVLERTDRGGDVTYHGPGQLVAYPIVTVPDDPAAGPEHVHRLEQVVIATLADLGLNGATSEGEYPGVWLDAGGPHARKIAAIGIRTLRTGPGRRRTLHGVALNVSTDLAMFGHIVPCGIAGSWRDLAARRGHRCSLRSGRRRVRGARRRGVRREAASTATTCCRAPPTRPGTPAAGERPLLRRLRQAGVAPEDGLDIGQRKPEWVRVPVRIGKGYRQLGSTVHDLGLVTVCEEAGCPNIYECWADGTATFMINGERCTRACGFCQVDTRHPLPLVTRRARTGGPGGGADAPGARGDHLCGPRRPARRRRRRDGRDHQGHPIPHARDDGGGLDLGLPWRRGVAGHDLRGSPRCVEPQHRDGGPPAAGRAALGGLRPQPGGARPRRAGGARDQVGPDGGLGEREDEVVATMADLRGVGVSIVTVGQYLRPSRDHLPVSRYWAPEEFDRLREAGTALGVAHVEASPLTRSSYHAREAAMAANQGAEPAFSYADGGPPSDV